ncbi:MAG: hypothetical protein V4641_26555 [Pseudomonadota bacterium]|jgi:hypothetical protein
MSRTMSLQLPADTILELLERRSRIGKSPDAVAAIIEAAECWLAAQNSDTKHSPLRGYQWKSLFLPEGTMVRSWIHGDYHYACVEGDELVFEGRALTPNQFASLHARSVRNAWHDLYVRRPDDKFYRPAKLLRKELAGQAKPQAREKAAPAQVSAAAPAPLCATAETMAVAPVPVPRNPQPGSGWTLPERRTMRFRLEDVAFD